MAISSVTPRSDAVAPSEGTRRLVQSADSVAPKTAAGGVDVSAPTPSPEHVAQAVKQVNDTFAQNGQNLYASVEKDQATGINVVKVSDRNTREVISQFPSKAIIAFAEVISQSQAKKGQLINARA
ncbi:MAG: flagellar protein FlaG [Gallionella sp.]|nr:flagellar protein FlaG [Gallionella sp.]